MTIYQQLALLWTIGLPLIPWAIIRCMQRWQAITTETPKDEARNVSIVASAISLIVWSWMLTGIMAFFWLIDGGATEYAQTVIKVMIGVPWR